MGARLNDDAARDPWVERLARLFREHPAWREAARFVDRRATSDVAFTHLPGEAWHLVRRGDETLLLRGPAADPDFAFRFTPGAIARLESVQGDAGEFAAALFALATSDDPGARVELRIVARFSRLVRRGYVRLLLAAGRGSGGIRGLADLARFVARWRNAGPIDTARASPAAQTARTSATAPGTPDATSRRQPLANRAARRKP